MNLLRHPIALLTLALTCMPAAQAQVTSYDAATSLLNIPSVSVGAAATFTGVALKHRGDLTFELVSFVDQPRVAFPGVASYDVPTSMLMLPAVKIGDATFIDVQLQDTGGFIFRLAAATPLPQDLIDDVNTLVRAVEQQTANGLWRNATERLALADACWASGGRTLSNVLADYDAHLAEYLKRDAYMIGRKVQNVQVLAVRNRSNPDGSTRREVDLQWDVVFTDGSVQRGEVQHLISGSSAGTPRCTTAQNSPALRSLGDQQLVSTRVRGNNLREERYQLNGGAPLNPLVRYRREIEWFVSDPMGNATHVVVTGPGPSNTTSGVTRPFSMMFLSPRLLRSAPELLGKPQNFVNWQDDDSFRNCFLASGAVPVVPLVDCKTGGSSNSWGFGYTSTPDAAADQSFVAQGWKAGAVYRFDVYNDDGWRTINGFASRTPIATYYETLESLPYTFVQMADRYPVLGLGGQTPAQLAFNATSATPASLPLLTWSRPVTQADGRVYQFSQLWEFQQGPKLGNPSGVLNPAYRTLGRVYPGPTATSTTNFPVSSVVSGQGSKTYTEYLLFYVEPGSGNTIRSRILFQ